MMLLVPYYLKQNKGAHTFYDNTQFIFDIKVTLNSKWDGFPGTLALYILKSLKIAFDETDFHSYNC